MAKKKNDDLFEDLGFEDQDDSTLELLDSDEPDQIRYFKRRQPYY